MILSLWEIVQIIAMSLAVGFIFSGPIKQKTSSYDPIKQYSKSPFLENLKNGIIIAAPAIVLHEMAHKFVAIGFGAAATINAPLGMYAVIIALKLLNFPFLFFVGGYVSISGQLFAWQYALISLAGPFTNLLIYLALMACVKFNLIKRKHYEIIGKAAKLNLFLFAFNMIPIPGFDGFNFFRALLSYVL